MKQILIILVAVMLGSTAISSYAEDDYKQRQGVKTINVLSEGSKAVTADKLKSEVSDEGNKNPRPQFRAEESSESKVFCNNTLKKPCPGYVR